MLAAAKRPWTLSDRELMEEALERINAIRAQRRCRELEGLPKGVRGMSFQHCVLGRALGSCIAMQVSRYDYGVSEDSPRQYRRDPVLAELERRFESGLLPDLEARHIFDPEIVLS